MESESKGSVSLTFPVASIFRDVGDLVEERPTESSCINDEECSTNMIGLTSLTIKRFRTEDVFDVKEGRHPNLKARSYL